MPTGRVSYSEASAGAGTAWRILGSSVSSTTRNFNTVVHSFPDVNLPGDTRQNTVVQIGWNQNTNGTREDETDGTLVLSFEEHYLQSGVAPAAFEWHLATIDTSGTARRPISGFFPKDGGAGSSLAFDADVISFYDFDHAAQFLQFNVLDKTVDIRTGGKFRSAINNEQVYQQRNVGDSAYLSLPWIDSGDQVRCAAKGLAVVGTAPTAGDYIGQYVTFNCTGGLPSGGTFLKGNIPAVTGSVSAFSLSGSVTGTLTGQVYNQSAGVAADAVLDIVTGGRDAYAMFRTSTAEWTVGVDKSDAGKFKVAAGNGTLGSADKLTLGTDGNLAVTGALTASTGFGCNGAAAQTAYASGGAATDAASTQTLANNIRLALIANGIMS